MESEKSLEKYKVYETTFIEATYDTLTTYEKSRQNELLIGFIIWVIFSFIIYKIVTGILSSQDSPLWLFVLTLIISLIITNYITLKIRKNRIRNRLIYINTRNKKRIKDEAKYLTENVRNQIITANKNLKKLREISLKIDRSIKKTETEFNDNAFSSYWDNIEILISYFLEYNSNLRDFPYSRERYYDLLKGRKHNFPEFPIIKTMLPNIESQLKEFKRVVRFGITNYEFASIYEHRKTRKVLIDSFNNLAEALNNIENKVDQALTNFNQRFKKNLKFEDDVNKI